MNIFYVTTCLLIPGIIVHTAPISPFLQAITFLDMALLLKKLQWPHFTALNYCSLLVLGTQPRTTPIRGLSTWSSVRFHLDPTDLGSRWNRTDLFQNLFLFSWLPTRLPVSYWTVILSFSLRLVSIPIPSNLDISWPLTDMWSCFKTRLSQWSLHRSPHGGRLAELI